MAEADYRLMTEATGQRIAAALEALHLATVTGVKGDAEQNYRHGDVNLTPANIGAVNKAGDTMTGSLALDNTDRSGRSIRFSANGTEAGWITTDNQTNVMQFLQHNPNVAGAFALYQFPAADENPYGVYEILTTKSPVTIGQGGTGATTPAVVISNEYSTVLGVINAVINRTFPISVQKNGLSRYEDMPAGYETSEWNMELIGEYARLTAMLFIYSSSATQVFIRHFYAYNWASNWTQIN